MSRARKPGSVDSRCDPLSVSLPTSFSRRAAPRRTASKPPFSLSVIHSFIHTFTLLALTSRFFPVSFLSVLQENSLGRSEQRQGFPQFVCGIRGARGAEPCRRLLPPSGFAGPECRVRSTAPASHSDATQKQVRSRAQHGTTSPASLRHPCQLSLGQNARLMDELIDRSIDQSIDRIINYSLH